MPWQAIQYLAVSFNVTWVFGPSYIAIRISPDRKHPIRRGEDLIVSQAGHLRSRILVFKDDELELQRGIARLTLGPTRLTEPTLGAPRSGPLDSKPEAALTAAPV